MAFIAVISALHHDYRHTSQKTQHQLAGMANCMRRLKMWYRSVGDMRGMLDIITQSTEATAENDRDLRLQ